MGIQSKLMCAVCLAAAMLVSVNVIGDESPVRGRYAEIPITGDIGVDTTPDGLSKALEQATRNKVVSVILLVIDAEGGRDIEAIEMADMLASVKSDLRVVAAVHRAIGPAMALVLASDDMVILDPGQDGIRLQYQPALGRDMAVDHAAYSRIHGLGPGAKLAVDAMFDPDVTVFAWRDGDGTRRAAMTRPDGVDEVMELPAGSLADGLSAMELEQLGIGRQAANVSRIGSELGYTSWTRSLNLAGLMRRTADEQSALSTSVQQRLDQAMSLTGNALELEVSLVELEASARAADPRRQSYNYRSRYSRRSVQDRANNYGYRGNWSYSGPSTRAWRTNSDQAVVSLGRVVTTIDQIFELGGEARDDLDWLKAQKLPPSMKGWVNEEIRILEQQLNPLLDKESTLMSRRAAAVSEAEFFQANRSTPVM